MKQVLTEARATRVVRQSKLLFDGMTDSRKARGKRHPLEGVLRLMVAGFASAASTLRAVESLGDDLSAKTRKVFGLRSSVSDTVMYRMLEEQDSAGFADAVESQVKQGLESKAIRNDLFPMGVVAFDGKKAFSGSEAVHPLCKWYVPDEGAPYYVLFALKASLVSSSARPCVHQQFIPTKANEMGSFEASFNDVNRRYGKSFEIATGDAGLCSRHNAALVNNANKAYLFAVKGNQPTLQRKAMSALGNAKTPGDHELCGEHRTVERYRGGVFTRELFRCRVEADDPEVEFASARELWRVRQTAEWRDDAGLVLKRTVEDRYFVINRTLRSEQALALVRLHWGIENGTNWTLDMVLEEDDRCPCHQGNGVVNVAWLRVLAYNLVAIWRSKLPSRHGEDTSWKRACELLRDAFKLLLPLDVKVSATLV